jgi:hypothetical protein
MFPFTFILTYNDSINKSFEKAPDFLLNPSETWNKFGLLYRKISIWRKRCDKDVKLVVSVKIAIVM